ncbi:histidine phosphatase family protein [Novacetimonas hansenii]|uniref:histidine phosphatase family protein n=1 Tax=Novacetimonas hansenii TaxID=436 RepID=UPI0039EB74D2
MHLTCLSLPAPDCLRRAIIPTRDDLPPLPPGQAAHLCATAPVACGDDTAIPVAQWAGRTPIAHAALRARDHGAWHGRALHDLPAPDVARWIADPDFAPPDGESLRAVLVRVADWLSRCPTGHANMMIIADTMVIRALVLATLGTGAEAFAALDIGPCTRTLVTFHNRWRVRQAGAAITF